MIIVQLDSKIRFKTLEKTLLPVAEQERNGFKIKAAIINIHY